MTDSTGQVEHEQQLVALDVDVPIWSRFFCVAPLVIIGTREEGGGFDLAPKHMAMPVSYGNYFAFVCTPSHRTFQNARREKAFTVSFPRPEQVILASLAAAPRCDDHSKPSLAALPTVPATRVDGVLLRDSYLFLECEVDRIVEGFGEECLVAGRIVAARVDERALRLGDRDDQELLREQPLLAYLPPGRYARVEQTFSFPFHAGFKR